MPRISYTYIKFSPERARIVEQANNILISYESQGFQLTLRQLYYQFVSRDLFPASWADAETGSTNNERSYKKLGDIVNDARLSGLMDWGHIVDRTRALEKLSTWSDPRSIAQAVVSQYREDLWRTQPRRIEVWVEKDALVGVIEPVCNELQVPYLSCRGYTSQSEMWNAGQRLLGYRKAKQYPLIIPLGDHDPSGKDMSRDIQSRLEVFTGNIVRVQRVALNMDQIEQYSPPPNPAKVTDSRAAAYIEEFGNQSWELDALEPAVIADLIRDAVKPHIDQKAWDLAVEEQEANRERLRKAAESL